MKSFNLPAAIAVLFFLIFVGKFVVDVHKCKLDARCVQRSVEVVGKERSTLKDDAVVNSAAIGFMTGDAAVGAVLGGSVAGGFIGAALSDDDE